LVKTLVDNMYYYQDELGSTSHIANASGALLEYYKYDLYGKPTYFDSTSQPLNSSTYGVKDLFTGQRWHSELGLYDDRNRFMSPDLGRFLQPDPIGFKGDASNLYRYCGNDWANRSDPMGLEYVAAGGLQCADLQNKELTSAMKDDRSFQEKLSADEVKYQANVDSQHATNMRNARAEVKQAQASAQLQPSRVEPAKGDPRNVSTITRSQAVDPAGRAMAGIDHPDGLYSQPWRYLRYDLKDAAGKPVGAGVQVIEAVYISSKSGMPSHYRMNPFSSTVTTAGGYVVDKYSAPFISPHGYATFHQTLYLDTFKRISWDTTLHADGSYNFSSYTESFH
jgi:RHS repeat-associated protein